MSVLEGEAYRVHEAILKTEIFASKDSLPACSSFNSDKNPSDSAYSYIECLAKMGMEDEAMRVVSFSTEKKTCQSARSDSGSLSFRM